MGYVVVIFFLAFVYVAYLCVVVPLGAFVAFAGYAVALPGSYLLGLVQVLVRRPGTLPPPPRWPVPGEGADPARLGYFHGPAAADVRHVAAVARGYCGSAWGVGNRRLRSWFRDDNLPVTAPVGIGCAIGMGAGGAVGMAGLAAIMIVHGAVTGVLIGLVRAAALGLRAADSALLLVKNVRMSCPHCFARVPYPAYECRRCRRTHRDVRPGRFGIFRRRCVCGAGLRTLLLFGSSRMVAYCPACRGPLEHRPGEAREVVFPFFGAAGAGKTRLLYAVVAVLHRWSETDPHVATELADAATAADLGAAGRFLASGRATAKTHMDLPRGQVIRLRSGGHTRLLQLFDAAGERFYQGETTEELGYLTRARTFVLVIDPLSVDSFWTGLPAADRARLAATRSAAPSPELAYQQTHQRIEEMGVRLARARLAVVFSRADLLDGPPDHLHVGPPDGRHGGPRDGPPDGKRDRPHGGPQDGSANGDVAEWARDALGLGNLVRSVRHQFGQVEFFRTAAVAGADGTVHPSVGSLTRWLLAPERLGLPRSDPPYEPVSPETPAAMDAAESDGE